MIQVILLDIELILFILLMVWLNRLPLMEASEDKLNKYIKRFWGLGVPRYLYGSWQSGAGHQVSKCLISKLADSKVQHPRHKTYIRRNMIRVVTIETIDVL